MKHTPALPAEMAERTYAHYFRRMHTRSRAIYLIVLTFITGTFCALFFIRVHVVVDAGGMLTALGERSWVKAPVSGQIAAVFVKDNQRVEKGQRLFTMDAATLENDLSSLKRRQRAVSGEIADLRQLLDVCRRHDLSQAVSLVSALYSQEYYLFKEKLALASGQLQRALDEYGRQAYLFEEGVLAEAEFAEYALALEEARTQRGLIFGEQGSRWQTALRDLIRQSEELASLERKFNTQKERFTIESDMGGILQLATGLGPGSFFTQGEQIAQLSPDSGLVAEIWVSPKDIGLLKEGMPVHIRIDAFDHQQWGILEGAIADISKDIVLSAEDGPFFEVTCALEKRALTLRNGYRGELKRGMTLQAGFRIAERTLFQLLYDNLADWLDPYEQNKGKTT